MNKKAIASGTSSFLMRLLLGGVFIYAGFSKLMEPPENFAANIAQYGVVPAGLIQPLSYIVPWIEWLFGMFVLLGYALPFSAAVLSAASAFFVVLILASGKLWSADQGSCGCFGEGGLQLTVRQIFMLDLINMLIGLALSRMKSVPLSIDRFFQKMKQSQPS